MIRRCRRRESTLRSEEHHSARHRCRRRLWSDSCGSRRWLRRWLVDWRRWRKLRPVTVVPRRRRVRRLASVTRRVALFTVRGEVSSPFQMASPPTVCNSTSTATCSRRPLSAVETSPVCHRSNISTSANAALSDSRYGLNMLLFKLQIKKVKG